MKRKLASAAAAILAVGVFSSCGSSAGKTPVNSDTIEIEQNGAFGTSSEAEVTEAPSDTSAQSPKVTSAPAESPDSEETAEETAAPEPVKLSYTEKIMFVGDDMCAALVGKSGITDDNVFAAKGMTADDILSESFSRSSGSTTAVEWARNNHPDYIYIWLGLNDLAFCNDYAYYKSMSAVVSALHEASPDSIIAVTEITPVARDSSWNNDVMGGDAHYDISVYNEMLEAVVSDLGIDNVKYVQVTPVLGEDGGTWLSESYDSGDGISLNDSGISALLRYFTENRFYNEATGDTEIEELPEITEETTVSEELTEEELTEDETEISEEDEAPRLTPAENYASLYPDLYTERPPYTVAAPKVCYLTFDDGPSDNTPAVLDILKKNNIKATFFIVGSSIDDREDILRRTVSEGHTIGIHTYSHDYEEIYASAGAYVADFNAAYTRINDVTGVKPWLFRFPGGSFNSFNTDTAEDIITEMTRRGFTYFDWNCATSDATVGSTYNSCIRNFKDTFSSDYEVILMHDSKEVTGEYLQEIIDYAKAEGYTFDTLDNADPVHF